MKVCVKCDSEKPLSEFHKNKNNRDGLVNRCKACVSKADQERYVAQRDTIRARTKAYAEANREKVRERYRQYRNANVDRIRQADRQYWAANRERGAVRNKAWRERNKDRLAQYRQEYRAANRDQIADYHRIYKRVNRAAVYAAIDRRRQRVAVNMSGADRALTVSYRQVIAGDPCVYCGGPSATVDHIEALTNGGTDHWWNLAPACMSCNTSKRSKGLLHYLMDRPKRT